MQQRIPVATASDVADTANTAGSIVLRDTDQSINVGQANVTNINDSGGEALGVKSISTNTTLDGNSTLVVCDATSAAFAVTLPAASAKAGQTYHIVKKDSAAHNVTITGNSGDNIVSDGAVANTYALTGQGKHAVLWSDGAQWYLK